MALVACSECQSQVSDRAVSCPQCGNVFTRCPECGNEVKPGAATCGNCGYPLVVAPPIQAFSASQSTSQPLLADNTQGVGFDSVTAPVVYAGFWRRFAAAIIDALIVGVVLIVADIILGIFVDTRSAAFTALSTGLSIGFGIAYYVGLESGRKQATLGKRALGIIVTDLHGQRVSNLRALGRYLAKIVSVLTLMIGYLMAGFTEKKQGLHDMMAGTLVIVKPSSR